jgi:DNA-binding GntR family transcriptional regulator
VATTDAPDAGTSLVDKAYYYIRSQILGGACPPDTPLRLQALATAIDVSIIPVREALRRLESERLVTIEANRGARVARLRLDDIRDAYNTRRSLELEALRNSMDALDASDISRARELNAEMVRLFQEGDDEAAYVVHRQLHFVFYEKARSEWMLQFINILWDHTERYRRIATKLRGDPLGIGAEHSAVVDAIELGRSRTATDALERHLKRSLEIVDREARSMRLHPGAEPQLGLAGAGNDCEEAGH